MLVLAGFCKNDKNHDVRLHIEALRIPRRAEGLGRSRQVGEAFFAIYPRPNQPHMKLSARQDEDWYRYSAVMALLRVGSEQPAMHCGRMAFTASLHEHRTPTALVVPTSLSPSTQEDQQAASPAAAPPALNIPASRRLLHTPESAYHSLPTEGHTFSPQVGKHGFGIWRPHAPGKQEQTRLAWTGFSPRIARWLHIGTNWSRKHKERGLHSFQKCHW